MKERVGAIWRAAERLPQKQRTVFLLRFVEDILGLAPLTKRDLGANNMFNAFDFTQKPRGPLILRQRDCQVAMPYNNPAYDD